MTKLISKKFSYCLIEECERHTRDLFYETEARNVGLEIVHQSTTELGIKKLEVQGTQEQLDRFGSNCLRDYEAMLKHDHNRELALAELASGKTDDSLL